MGNQKVRKLFCLYFGKQLLLEWISLPKAKYFAMLLFQNIQEIETQVLRIDKIKLLSKLEKCKGMEGAKVPEDRVLNGVYITTKNFFGWRLSKNTKLSFNLNFLYIRNWVKFVPIQSKKYWPFKTLADKDGGDERRERRSDAFQLFMENQLLEGQVHMYVYSL